MLIIRLYCTPKFFSMEYSRIVGVTGLPGLYEIINSKTDGAIVRSLDDGSTKFVSSRVHNLTHLESIEIYTTGDNVPLSDIFEAIKNSSEPFPEGKDNNALKNYFEKVYPELDFERVYASDMKKMVNWYNALQQHNIDFTKQEDADETEENSSSDEPKDVATTLEEKNEKVVLEVAQDTVPEVAKTKTKKK